MAEFFKGKNLTKLSNMIISGVVVAILVALVLGEAKLEACKIVKTEGDGSPNLSITSPVVPDNPIQAPTDSAAVLPIKNLFKAWELLSIDLYMAQWAKDGIQHSRKFKPRTYPEIWSIRQTLFNKLRQVKIDYYTITKMDRTSPNSVSIDLQYSMTYYFKNGKIITEKDVLEKYMLIRDAAYNRWLIQSNFDYIE